MADDTKSAPSSPQTGVSLKRRLLKRKAALWTERNSWQGDWLDLVDYVLPTAGRFFATNSAQGAKVRKSRNIYDSTAKRSLNTLGAGLMAGMSSPARPWFRLSTGDTKLDDVYAVKLWLSEVEKSMRAVFAGSNVYRALHQVYTELGAFGTGCVVLTEDFDDVIHCYALTIGEYAIATDNRGVVNTLFREFNMSVGQIVDQFGLDNCSTAVKRAYGQGNLDQWILVHHVIEPRANRDTTKLDSINMKFASIYYEVGGDADTILGESGFKNFNCLAPRWLATASDNYGTGPGHDALPDIRQLQHAQLRKQQGIDYKVNPPLQAPSTLKAAGVNRLPGGVQYVDAVGGENAIKTLFDVQLDLKELREDIVDVRERIKGHFYEDLFLMLANDTRSGITATEVAERHEEKLLMLGPVLERLQNELFDPLIDFTFDRMMGAKPAMVNPPPPELQGRAISVVYISTLAQAQRAVALQATDRLVATAGAVSSASGTMDAWDKINIDELMDSYAEGLGNDPRIMNSDDRVLEIRAQRQQAQKAQESLAAAESASKSVANVGTLDPNNVQDVMSNVMGYGTTGAPA